MPAREERDNMVASGVLTASSRSSSAGKRVRRQTFDVKSNESTQVVWRPRTRRRRSMIPWVAAAIVVVIAIGATVALLLVKSAGRDDLSASAEDPLALYQVATELYEQREHAAALQMLRRAREVTTHERAHKQLDALEREIAAALDAIKEGRPPPPIVPRAPLVDGFGEAPKKVRAPSRATSPAEDPATNRVRAASRPQRTAGMLYVDSDAVGDVLVDGRPTGLRTPTTLSLPPGPYTVEVVPLLDPSLRVVRQVTVNRGGATRVYLAVAEERSRASDTPRHPSESRRQPDTGRTDADELAPEPTVGTVTQTTPAIGVVGSDKPTIGIVKEH